ncbi:imidazole glycerol phosphate synthase subunit HisF [Helicobacter sp. 23-1045]
MEQKKCDSSKHNNSNLAFRIIPCLDVKNGAVVKGVNFVDLQSIGDPVAIAKAYNDKGADEIVFLDITASVENRGAILEVVKKVAKEVFIPFSVGGGVRNLDDIYALLNAGCDKVSINSAAIKNPALIEEGAKRFGSQCIVVAIDVKRIENQSQWSVFINGGRIDTGIDYFKWAKQVESLGAGEILLTSMDSDGTKNGYDLPLLQWSAKNVKIPLIASGGAGKMEHILEAYQNGADAALAASIFHYNEIQIADLKTYLADNGVPIRL